MDPKPIIGGRVFQGPNLVPEIPSGFSQKGGPIRPHLPGDFVKNINVPLTPPTLAPVLSYSNDFESFIVDLFWTPSDKGGSAGFGYRVEILTPGSVSWSTLEFTGLLSAVYDGSPNSGEYSFRVFPFNDAGEGPVSNTITLTLPGESSSQSRLIEDGTGRLLEDGSFLLLG